MSKKGQIWKERRKTKSKNQNSKPIFFKLANDKTTNIIKTV